LLSGSKQHCCPRKLGILSCQGAYHDRTDIYRPFFYPAIFLPASNLDALLFPPTENTQEKSKGQAAWGPLFGDQPSPNVILLR